jgi:hypothetical protein
MAGPSPWNAFAPELGAGLRMVGDAVASSQSTLAVVLSTLRVVSPLLEHGGLTVASD